MIYIFGSGENLSIIVREDFLSEEDKQSASLCVESLPIPELKDGFNPVLTIDENTKELLYVYKEQTPDEKRYYELQQLVLDGKITQEEMNELL